MTKKWELKNYSVDVSFGWFIGAGICYEDWDWLIFFPFTMIIIQKKP